jgi:hypothetical protein
MESIAYPIMFVACVENGDCWKAGDALKGNAVEPLATETNGKLEPLKTHKPSGAEIPCTTISAVPSAIAVMGT